MTVYDYGYVCAFTGDNGTLNVEGGTVECGSLSMNGANGLIDIEAGTLKIDGDEVSTINGYVTANKIVGYNDAGTVNVTYTAPYTVVTATEPPYYTWTGAISKNWNTSGNWTGGIPTSVKDALLNDNADCEIGANATCYNLQIGHGDSGSSNKLTINSGTVDVEYCLYSGTYSGDSGTLIVNGGTLNVLDGWLYTGYQGTSNIDLKAGTVNLKDVPYTGTGTSTIDIEAATVIIDGDVVSAINTLIGAGKIIGYGGDGTVNIDYGISNSGKTTVTATAAPLAWSEVYAPAKNLFTNRGTATVKFGSQYAAPGIPTEQLACSGVIEYRDNTESFRNYDLYFTPSLSIWKLVRYEGANKAQYVGGYHFNRCLGDSGYHTSYPPEGGARATDRCLMPALGCTQGWANSGYLTRPTTNYGCQNSSFETWPIDNYQAAGSASGLYAEVLKAPTWSQSHQSLYSVTLPYPWNYYEGVLDDQNAGYLADLYTTYSVANGYPSGTADWLQDKLAAALNNVMLENQIRIMPDGTVMLTYVWTDIAGDIPWLNGNATDGTWLALDSNPSGKIWFYNPNTSQYANPTYTGDYADVNTTNSSEWVGCFIDSLRTNFGLGFYFDSVMNFNQPIHYPSSPAILSCSYFPTLDSYDGQFRQMFMKIGTKEEMQAMASTLNPYVKGVKVDAIRPTSAQDGPVYATSAETTCTYGWFGKYNSGAMDMVGIHTLPAGLTAADVNQAILRIPQPDICYTENTSAIDLTFVTKHINATSDTTISTADRTSAALSTIGTLRTAGALVEDKTRFIDFDVTAQVKADITASRASFAWRVEPTSVPDAVYSYLYMPTVDSTDSTFLMRGATLYIYSE